jgi:DNA polymerase III subunit delta'
MTWPRVIGQERVKQILLSALRNNRLPHASLFVGSDGVGKDAMALELARLLQCEHAGEEACNRCASCIMMNSMQHPDVRLVVALPVGKGEKADDSPLEKLSAGEIQLIQEQFRMKAENPYHRIILPRASIIKINSIRDIRRESAMFTYGHRKRVIIISRADEMGEAAANTLLKTLEEPSSNTLLILTTSRRGALLSTIISRCQIVQFDPLTEHDIRDALIERNGVESAQAALVARLAHGSYTKAIELLQEDIASQRLHVVSFVRAALGNNVVAVTDAVDEVCTSKDRDVVVRFLNMMLMWFRDALVLLQGGEVINLDQQDDIQRFVSKFPLGDLIKTLADIERAIFLVERNVYINLVMLQLAVQLKRNILTPGSIKLAETVKS